MDAIVMLKDDHKKVAKMFREFDNAKDPAKAKKVAVAITNELTVHATIEEQVFYPAARAEVEQTDDMVLEAEQEHHVMDLLIEEIRAMDPTDESFRAKVTVLKEVVEHHVDEEEHELFPQVREALGRKRLNEIGDELEAAKQQQTSAA